MNVEKTKKAIEVMNGYLEGKTIIYEKRCGDYRGEADIAKEQTLSWDWNTFDYRIKPEPHYRPFRNAEEVGDAVNEHGSWLKTKEGNTRVMITSYCENRCWFVNSAWDYIATMEHYTFLDGTPFGKLEE